MRVECFEAFQGAPIQWPRATEVIFFVKYWACFHQGVCKFYKSNQTMMSLTCSKLKDSTKLPMKFYNHLIPLHFLCFILFSWYPFHQMVRCRGGLQRNGDGAPRPQSRRPLQFLLAAIRLKDSATISWSIGKYSKLSETMWFAGSVFPFNSGRLAIW